MTADTKRVDNEDRQRPGRYALVQQRERLRGHRRDVGHVEERAIEEIGKAKERLADLAGREVRAVRHGNRQDLDAKQPQRDRMLDDVPAQIRQVSAARRRRRADQVREGLKRVSEPRKWQRTIAIESYVDWSR